MKPQSTESPLTPALSPQYRREGVRRRPARTVLIGIALIVLFGSLAFTPLLLGRGGINRYIVAFSIVGILLGASCVIHGTWDWLAGRRR